MIEFGMVGCEVMGVCGWQKVMVEFDEQQVVECYWCIIYLLIGIIF